MNFLKNSQGFQFETDDFIVVFGNAASDLQSFQQTYTQFEFIRAKQDHTDRILELDPLLQQQQSVHFLQPEDPCYDALSTTAASKALVVQTADCIPLMIYSPIKKQIAAVHAGWRGVENQIIIKTLQKFSHFQTLKIFIGPHILQNSFEVQQDVKERIEDSTNDFYSSRGSKPEFNKDYVVQKNDRYYIDLQKIVIDQLEALEIQKDNIFSVNVDTKTSLEFNSHRRTPTAKVRNWSWIVLK